MSLTHLLCLSATLGFSGSATAALFTSGHGDFAVGLHDGEFEFGYHLGEGDDTTVQIAGAVPATAIVLRAA